MLKGDSTKALEFLERMYPDGPWCLAAIEPEQKKPMQVATFYPANADECLTWIDDRNGKFNLYWHVNPVLRAVTKKAERTDIAAVAYFHVDVDPSAPNEHFTLEQMQERILDTLTSKLPRDVPAPSAIIFSGGGYQAFWKLAEPIAIDGDLARAEDAKRYNQQLELLFRGDNCHNIDRLMRLPQTVNVPNAKKQAKGRKPVIAKVIDLDTSRAYPLAKFTQAAMVQVNKELSTAGTKTIVQISGNVKRLSGIEELKECGKWGSDGDFQRVAAIIMQGFSDDPAEVERKTAKLGKAPSRSEWLFDVVCNLLRAGVPDAIVYSVITDAQFGISSSVLELKTQAHRYAVRQITRAKEYTTEPDLAELNDKYCLVWDVAGKVLIATERKSEIMQGVMEWTFIKPDEFNKRYENRQVVTEHKDAEGNIAKVTRQELGTWWRKHALRRQVEQLVFQPDKVDVPDAINLWRGFTVDAISGTKHQGYIDHLKSNICQGDEAHFNYLWRWMARVVQRPAEAGQVAVVLLGLRGTGKGVFVNTFGKLFGRHYVHATSAQHIVGNFNGHLRACCLLFADEATFVGDKKTQGVLKGLITEPSIMIERKGIDAEVCPNYLHVIMASNDEHVIRAGMEERRYFVLDVSAEQMQNSAYFSAIAKDMDEGGLSNLLYDLLHTDLSEFEVRDVPKTKALHDQADLSLSPLEAWWLRNLREGTLLANDESWRTVVPKEELLQEYVSFATAASRGVYSELNETSFGIYLKKLIGRELDSRRITVERDMLDERDGRAYKKRERVPCYVLPDLKTCRDYWGKVKRKEPWIDLPLE